MENQLCRSPDIELASEIILSMSDIPSPVDIASREKSEAYLHQQSKLVEIIKAKVNSPAAQYELSCHGYIQVDLGMPGQVEWSQYLHCVDCVCQDLSQSHRSTWHVFLKCGYAAQVRLYAKKPSWWRRWMGVDGYSYIDLLVSLPSCRLTRPGLMERLQGWLASPVELGPDML
ncbi:MAG: hypothetical protein SFV17_10340 [Candidatus Obscuribacter sp.]|nr:hypothetical protein [Candidatus Obscuribacter sp.]